MIIPNYFVFLMKMPLYGPPRLKRRRIGYGRKNVLAYGRSGVGKAMRMIGGPSMTHTFARPGKRIEITDNGTLLQANSTGIPAPLVGIQEGFAAAGRTGGTLSNSIKFGLSEIFMWDLLSVPGDLANLYDNYRIKMVKVRIDLSYNQGPATNGVISNAGLPMLHYCIDPDDNSTPTTADEVLQYTKSRSVRLGDKPVFINFVPRAQGAVSSSTIPGSAPIIGNMLPSNTWLDTQNGRTIPHFGLKMFFENFMVGGTPYPWVMTFTPTYILECKNVH